MQLLPNTSVQNDVKTPLRRNSWEGLVDWIPAALAQDSTAEAAAFVEPESTCKKHGNCAGVFQEMT